MIPSTLRFDFQIEVFYEMICFSYVVSLMMAFPFYS
jgi:hypothetical protein